MSDVSLRDRDSIHWVTHPRNVREQLLRSAVVAFYERGYSRTTTREITEAVRLSPGTLYVHFSSKLELLRTVVTAGHMDLLNKLKASDKFIDAPALALATSMKDYSIWHAENRLIGSVIHREMRSLDRPAFEHIADIRSQITHLFRVPIAQLLSPKRENEIELVTQAVISLGRDVTFWYRPNRSTPPDELGARYGSYALRLCGIEPDESASR